VQQGRKIMRMIRHAKHRKRYTMTSTVHTLVAMALVAGLAFPSRSMSQVLTLEEARTSVQAECKGSYDKFGACHQCVRDATRLLLNTNQITRAQANDIEQSFVQGECREGCIPTTCEIEEWTCGRIASRCGDALTCGPPCSDGGPDAVRCYCNNWFAVDLCTTVDCSSGLARVEICAPVCDSRGGISSTACVPAAPQCAP
jgi:hypothetical protein